MDSHKRSSAAGSNRSAPVKPKVGRPLASAKDKTLEATKPWIADGVSRRTWYRRRAADQTNKEPSK